MRLSEEHYDRSRYEQDKRAATIELLERRRYERAFEPGCGFGHLSRSLTSRCGELVVWECDSETHRRASDVLADHPNIRVECASVPAQWPAGSFDLIVLCEFLYYLDPNALHEVAQRAVASLSERGEVLACHWRHPIPESDLVGDDVHRLIDQRSGLTRVRDHRNDDYVLTLWRREATT